MENIYYDLRLDIQKDNAIDSGIRLTQGDNKALFFRIAVTNGGEKFDSTETTPTINFLKPDGTCVVGTPIENGDLWVYQILGNELQSAGKVLGDMKFTYQSGRISSSKFTFIVEKDTTSLNPNASASYISPMEEMLREMTNYRDQGYTIVQAAEVQAANAAKSAEDARQYAPSGYDDLVDKVDTIDADVVVVKADILDIYDKLDNVASDWDSVTGKPFETLGTDFEVNSNNELVIADSIHTDIDDLKDKTANLDANGNIDASNVDYDGGSVSDALTDVTTKLSNIYEDGFASRNLFSKENILLGTNIGGSTNAKRALSQPIYLDSDNVTIKAESISNLGYVCYFFENSTTLSSSDSPYSDWVSDDSSKTVTVPSDKRWLRVLFNNNNGISSTDFDSLKLQIEKGSNSTEYTEFAKSNVEITSELSWKDATVTATANSNYTLNTNNSFCEYNGFLIHVHLMISCITPYTAGALKIGNIGKKIKRGIQYYVPTLASANNALQLSIQPSGDVVCYYGTGASTAYVLDVMFPL